MNQAVCELKPAEVWEKFEQLNDVPRPSKHEERVIEFMKQFGEGLGLETVVDAAGNVLIRKPATAGMENRKCVVLQAHLDMVHQKNNGTEFDFLTQGIQSWIDGQWVKARGTTLGADNGIGAASIMAVLASTDFSHGPIEALFTIDEETGMTGAFALAPGWLQGDILLNTDTEDHGELCIGCAGGIDTNVSMTYAQTAASGTAFRISITGLKGGHSGCDIHLGRGNANKIMNRILYSQVMSDSLSIATIDGGSLRNAIPRESFATVVSPEQSAEQLQAGIADLAEVIKTELRRTEPNLEISVEAADLPQEVMEAADQKQLVSAIYAAPVGVLRMSDEMPGLVETSTSMARVQVKAGTTTVQFLSRSSVESAKVDVCNQIESAFCFSDATVEHTGGYPGWNPNADSEILELMKHLFREMFGEAPTVNAIHAGLECGIIGSHYPEMDMISFGPTIKNPHSPDEMCEIASVEKYWQFLKTTLKNIPIAV